jgi:CheY-like chemotaxis protein
MQQSLQTNPVRDTVALPLGEEPKWQGRLLIVEDSQCMQQIIHAILRKMNVDVKIVGNGQMACTIAENSKAVGNPYDLILMDIQMPEMNGYDATQWLRTHGWEGPIVALTAYSSVEDRKKCLDAGCTDHLCKPITEMALRDVLTRHMSRTDRGDQPSLHKPLPDQQAPSPKAICSESVQETQGVNSSTDLFLDTEGPMAFEFL